MKLHLVDPAVLEVVILEGLPQQRDLVLGHLSPFQGRQGPLLVLVETLILKVTKLVCKFINFLSSISLALSVNIDLSFLRTLHGRTQFKFTGSKVG